MFPTGLLPVSYMWSITAGVVVLTAVIVAVLYYLSVRTLDKWRELGVPYVRPVLPLFGNYLNVALCIDTSADTYRTIYQRLAGRRYGGFYQMRTPYLMIRDPELIDRVLRKDFASFPDRGVHTDYTVNPLSENLFFMDNPRWKVIRNKLSPAFASGRLKQMHDRMTACGDAMMTNLRERVRGAPGGIDFRDAIIGYTTDVIGTCAFGLRSDELNGDRSEFRKYGKTVFKATPRYLIKELMVMISPPLAKFFNLTDFPVDATEFFRTALHETIAYRETNNVFRNDFVQSLIQARRDLVLNENLPQEEKFTELQIVANAFIMFAAGFETTSTALCFCLHELALKKHIQQRVREEVRSIRQKHNGKVDNEFLSDLKYMDMVIAETLRKYPAVFALFRKSSQKYHVPNDSLIIDKDQKIVIPIVSLHYDHRYYPDPETFDPDRFLPEEKAKRPNGTYLPFGDGPRICIGKRFAEIEMKLALVDVLSEFEVEPCEKTEIPIKFSNMSMIMIPKGEVWLKFNPIFDK